MQKDLFGAATVPPFPKPYEQKNDFLHRFRLQLRMDQTIMGVLLLLVVYVLVFSFGVESGKRYAMAEIKAERAMRERMARELGEKIFANSHPQEMTAPSSSATPVVPLGSVETSAPAAAQLKTTISASVSGKYMIQTVTYTSKAAAEQQLKRLAGKGYGGAILPQGRFQQVCVGGFETRAQAMQILGQLKNQGLAPQDAYIRTLA